MALKARFCAISYDLRWLLILLFTHVSYGTQSDISCLRKIQDSLEDPYNSLNETWDFTNTTEGAICRFKGIDCWHVDESRVLSIKLTDMGLKGQFPLGLENCTSLTELDLSGNRLSGSLPPDISKVLGYITNLDLSDNNFSGEIPASLSNCTYLNDVNLGYNQFSGHIPQQLGDLARLRAFNVANNHLSGPVPHFDVNIITAESYANNAGLCGLPLDACPARKSRPWYIVVGAGDLSLVIIVAGIVLLFKLRKSIVRWKKTMKKRAKAVEMKNRAKAVKVIMFENSDLAPEMSMQDLIIATNSFDNDTIISSGLTGKMYKATLPNGVLFMIKRLQDSNPTEDEFLREMNTFGSLKHPNLLPILGYCVWEKERFLVYKYMEKGSLYNQLHPSEPEPEARITDWPLSLKIAIGVANGLAWLDENRDLRLIHRSISSKCILLDNDFEPKLHELCLSRLINLSQAHFSTLAKGEVGDLGFLAPEYTNVHRFGEVLLELITGEKPTDVVVAPDKFKGSLLGWVTELLSTNTCDLDFLIDKSLLGKGVDDELSQFLILACSCVSPTAKDRPTMVQVYQQLRAIGEKYQFMINEDEARVPTNNGDTTLASEITVSCV